MSHSHRVSRNGSRPCRACRCVEFFRARRASLSAARADPHADVERSRAESVSVLRLQGRRLRATRRSLPSLPNTGSNPGVAVFTRSGNFWQRSATLQHPLIPTATFGVAIDGNLAVELGNTGAAMRVFVYRRSFGNWSSPVEVAVPGANTGFLYSEPEAFQLRDGRLTVQALATDGTRVVHVFELDNAGTVRRRSTLASDDANPGFGASVALSNERIVVGRFQRGVRVSTSRQPLGAAAETATAS